MDKFFTYMNEIDCELSSSGETKCIVNYTPSESEPPAIEEIDNVKLFRLHRSHMDISYSWDKHKTTFSLTPLKDTMCKWLERDNELYCI